MERICSTRSKFFPLRVDPILDGLCHPGNHQEFTEIVPHVKMIEKYSGSFSVIWDMM